MLALLGESALRSLLLGVTVWIGLKVLRVKNPHVHMMSWTLVLLASLSMPLLTHWVTMTIPANPLPVQNLEALTSQNLPPEPLNSVQAAQASTPGGDAAKAGSRAINWWAVATVAYAAVAGVLLLRLAIGLYLTWRLARAAQPIRERWALGLNVCASDIVGVPVTFGSTILLPSECTDWDGRTRRAVLSHESAHVANRDFYVLLLATLNRAVFWFSPFAWWQLTRLAELAEVISDARAVEVVEDRCSYAEILLDLVQRVRHAPAGLEMARACTVRARVERILAAAAMPAHLGWRKRVWTAAAILPLVVASAVSIVYSRPAASTVVTGSAPDQAAARMPERVSFYSLNRAAIFAISRSGDELFGQLSGQRRVRLAAAGDGSWSYPAAAGQITFAIDEAPKGELTLNQNGREMRAARIAELAWRDTAV